MSWLAEGPPREGGRTVMGIPFFEVQVADDYLLAYSVDDERRRVAVLWIRARPGGDDAQVQRDRRRSASADRSSPYRLEASAR